MWVIILLFILIYYLNSLCLEHDTEDVDEAFITPSLGTLHECNTSAAVTIIRLRYF
jgi:hypothetical protein